MSMRIVSLLVSILLFQVYAAAGNIYDNGPKNDDSTAWNFTGQYFASDTFTVSGGSSTVSGASIWVLIFPTDHNPTAEITITSQANGGNVYFDQVLQFSESNCYAAGWGYNWCEETAAWENGPVLPNGTYWVNLKNRKPAQWGTSLLEPKLRRWMQFARLSITSRKFIWDDSLRSIHDSGHARRQQILDTQDDQSPYVRSGISRRGWNHSEEDRLNGSSGMQRSYFLQQKAARHC